MKMDFSIWNNFKTVVATPQPTSEYADHISVMKCPIIGRIHFVNDTYGIMQLAFVVWYWLYGTFIPLFIVLIPGYHDGHISGIFIAGKTNTTDVLVNLKLLMCYILLINIYHNNFFINNLCVAVYMNYIMK